MAYVDGESLGQRIRTGGPLPPAEVARVLKQVARALAYAHDHGVVHRDVKPDNILLENPTGRVLVTDYGIARVGAGSGNTGPREVMGTAEFMSPEQASGAVADGRSDLYSLGAVAYYVLSGRLPFEERDAYALMPRHATDPAPPLAAVAPPVPRPGGRCRCEAVSWRLCTGRARRDSSAPCAASATPPWSWRRPWWAARSSSPRCCPMPRCSRRSACRLSPRCSPRSSPGRGPNTAPTPRRSAACGFGAGRWAAGCAVWPGWDSAPTALPRRNPPPRPIPPPRWRGRTRPSRALPRPTAQPTQSLPRLPELLLRLAEREPHELPPELRPAEEARAGDGCDARFAGEPARERVVR